MSHSASIRSFRQLADLAGRGGPVITLFSGGLDSTYLLLRLKELGVTDIHAVSVDLGEDESLEHKIEIADAIGVRLHVFDRREEFAKNYVLPALFAHAVYLGIHPISSSLSRPLIAKTAVELAGKIGANTILHTANRSQNTLRRLNNALELLGFGGDFGSPYDLDPVDREQKIQELKNAGIDHLNDRLTSGDSNLWCREFESGILDDPEDHAVPESIYRWSSTAQRPPIDLTVTYEHGVPVAIDGVRKPFVDLVEELNVTAGAYGLGRYSGLEHLDHGEKVLEIREMPAAWLLLRSSRHLESACLDAESIREKMHVEQAWVRESLEGRWFGPLHEALQSFVDTCARSVSGSVTWRLSPGNATTRAILADNPLYIRDREQWERSSIAAESAAFAS